MSVDWMHLSDDARHSEWSCTGCRRKAYGPKGQKPTPCDFCKPKPKGGKK